MDRKTVINYLKEFKKKINRHYPVKHFIIFGSMVTDSYKIDSDIDLIIVSERFSDYNFIDRAGLMYDYWNYDCPVDFLCFTPKEFEEKKKGISIVKEALKEGLNI